MFGKILTVDGPVQAPEPDDGVGQEHLHPELIEDRGQKEWVNRRLGSCGFSIRMGAQGADSLPPSSRRREDR
jgi:hypothetical protein